MHQAPAPRWVERAQLQRRIRVARGREPGDLLIQGGSIVNVFTQTIEPADVVVCDGWIAGVGQQHGWSARHTIDATGHVLMPGLLDGHIHVESTMLMPAELGRLLVPRGTTTLIADPHEIGNVQGIAGIDMLLAASDPVATGLPLDLFFMASSCVPATSWDDAGATLGREEVAELLTRSRVLGLAEVMDMEAVLNGEPSVLDKILAALAKHRAVDGHAPGLTGASLQAYVAAGMRADHESTELDEARAKARLGMMIQVREGSAEHNLDTLLPGLKADELGDWCIASDDIHPDDVLRQGHLDGILRRIIAAGVPPARAIRHATLVPARHYGLTDRGALAPGYRADLVSVRDLSRFDVSLVVKNGTLVARDGAFLATLRPPAIEVSNTIRTAPLDETSFILKLPGGTFPVIRIIPNQIVTGCDHREITRSNGHWEFDPNHDIALTASIERHRATGRVGLGLVSGFRFRRDGALGSSVAHDAHNLILAGTNPGDMLACAQALREMGGGFVVAAEGEIKARLPLPVAGLLSTSDIATVVRQLQETRDAAAALGCDLHSPFGTLSFLALPVIPELRITDQGLFDVTANSFVRP